MSAERFAHLVVRRLQETGRRPGAAFSVRGLLSELLPYEVARSELPLATKAEYDLAVLALLGDEERVVLRDPELARAVEEERESPEPGLAFLEEFPECRLRLNLNALPGDFGPGLPADHGPVEEGEGPGEGAVGDAPREGSEQSEGWDPTGGVRASALAGAVGSGPPGEEAEARARPERDCTECGRSLPEVEEARFCPYCGAEVEPGECPACGAELEREWIYCVRCGSRARG